MSATRSAVLYLDGVEGDFEGREDSRLLLEERWETLCSFLADIDRDGPSCRCGCSNGCSIEPAARTSLESAPGRYADVTEEFAAPPKRAGPDREWLSHGG